MQDRQYYQQTYYGSRMKTEFDAHWKIVKHRIGAGGRLAEMNLFCERKWEEETDEFKESIRSEVQRQYEEEMEQYKRRGEWNRDPSSYHECVDLASHLFFVKV